MTKPEFIAEVAKVAETTKVDAEKVVNAMLDTVQDTLAKGDSIQFVGFGTFEVKERALDHHDKNMVVRAYNHKANFVEQLKPLMNWWSDFICELKG